MFNHVLSVALSLLFIASSVSAKSQVDTSQSPQRINKKKLAVAIGTETAFYAGGLTYLQYIWYKDHEPVPFHFYNDNKGYLQIDKFGHTYGAYIESYIGYHWLRSAGVSKNKSLLYGGSLGLLLQTPIEIFDGIYEGWGFSWGDMAANAAGSALLIGQEALFDQQIVTYKFSFWRSEYSRNANGYLGDSFLESVFLDYNGHTYWLSTNLQSIAPKINLPPWLNIAAGYSANGMYGEFKNRTYYDGEIIPEASRQRQFLLSPDIDWTKIPTNRKLLKIVFRGMVFIKMPLPALELNSKGKIRGYWMYY